MIFCDLRQVNAITLQTAVYQQLTNLQNIRMTKSFTGTYICFQYTCKLLYSIWVFQHIHIL